MSTSSRAKSTWCIVAEILRSIPRVSLHKPRKPMHKPFCGKIGRGADRKDARGLSLHQALGSDGEAIKRVPHDREILATRFRYDQALAFAIEQLDPSSASILRLLVLDVFSDHGFVVPDSGYEKPRAQKLWPIQLRTCSPMLTGLVGGVMNQYNAVRGAEGGLARARACR